MRRFAIAAAVLTLWAAGCQKKGADSDLEPAYAADVERICHVERLSGAERDETQARAVIAAEWLGNNVETQEARDFLASLVPLAPADKAARLRAEAASAGLDDCPTAAAWEQLKAGDR